MSKLCTPFGAGFSGLAIRSSRVAGLTPSVSLALPKKSRQRVVTEGVCTVFVFADSALVSQSVLANKSGIAWRLKNMPAISNQASFQISGHCVGCDPTAKLCLVASSRGPSISGCFNYMDRMTMLYRLDVSIEETLKLARFALEGKEGRLRAQQQLDDCRGGEVFKFGSIDFQALRAEMGNTKELLSFEELSFEKCVADFSGADFGDGSVSFARCSFGGSVSFENARFSIGDICFDEIVASTVLFDGVRFIGGGTVSFRGARVSGENFWKFSALSSKDLDFSCADNGSPFRATGGQFFVITEKHDGKTVSFQGAVFDCVSQGCDLKGSQNLAEVNLSGSTWSGRSGSVQNIMLQHPGAFRFSDANLQGLQSFYLSILSLQRGLVSFEASRFPVRGLSTIWLGNLGDGIVNFENVRVDGVFRLRQEREAHWSSSVSFRGATFTGPVDVSGLNFGPVPDFIGTLFSQHLSLEGLDYEYDRRKRYLLRDTESGNAAKFQRLKELAENNKDHTLALKCFSDEMRARRWQKSGISNRVKDSLDQTYDLVSAYGQTILRPLVVLIASWFVFAGWYDLVSPRFETVSYTEFLGFAIAMTAPFLPASSSLRSNEIDKLFGDPAQTDLWAVYGVMGLQGLVSVILLFLIGLGLRNRFRI